MSRVDRCASQTLRFHAPCVLGALAFALGVLASGCESAPIRAFEGARHYSAGTEALNQGQDTRAIEELQQAAVLVPKASEIQNHLGLAYWSGGRIEAARAAFERAIALDCENVAARANLDHLMASIEAHSKTGHEGGQGGG